MYIIRFTDVDECSAGTDACVDATCTNTDGGYTCTCKTGFTFKSGSSYICEGIFLELVTGM